MTDLDPSTPVERTITLSALGATGASALDRRGVLAPFERDWVVDWAVGAQDGWHLASGEAGSRQSLDDATPVVRTALRVPDGAVEHRCWAALDGDRPVVVTELHDAAPVAVAVAIVIRPAADGTVGSIDLDGTTVAVDGRVALSFPRPPSRCVGGPVDEVLASVAAGVSETDWPTGGLRRAEGDAAAAFVFPLPHTATLRVVVPTGAGAGTGTGSGGSRPFDPAALAPVENVIAGWRSQTAGGPRVDLPEREVETAVEAARRHLLARVGDGVPRRSDGSSVAGVDRAEMAMALDEQGLPAAARQVLEAMLDDQGSDGAFDPDRLDATASWLVALDRHRRLSGDDAFVARVIEPIASAAHWLHRRHVGPALRRSSRFFGRGSGPDPAATDDDRRARDARWARRGLDAAASMLRAVGQVDAAALVDEHVVALVHDMSSRGIVDAGEGSERLEGDVVAMLRAAVVEGAPCWTWPSAIDGDDPARSAAFLRLVRAILVDDSGDGIDLLPGPIDEWFGGPLAVHDLPTAFGRLSFALRWHGARPALLWDLLPDEPGGADPDATEPVRLAAPRLDGGWTSVERSAEALLEEPPHVHRHDGRDHHEVDEHEHDDPSGSPTRTPLDGGGSFM